MQIVRTIIWVLLLAALLAFSFFNWDPVEVVLWENLVLETKVPALVIVAFLIGLVPMWAYHRSVKWSLKRRIRSLENAARSNALQKRHDPAENEPSQGGQPVDRSVDKPAENIGKPGGGLTPTDPAFGTEKS